MLEMLKNWHIRRFTDPQAMALLTILLFCFIAIYFFSDILAPLLIAIVLAYLLEWPIRILHEKLKFPRIKEGTIFILGGFIGVALLTALIVIPMLVNQTVNLFTTVAICLLLNEWLLSLPESYPELVDYQMVDSVFSTHHEKYWVPGNRR